MPGLLKQPAAPRQRAPSSLSRVSTPPVNASQPPKLSKVAHLKLPSTLLAQFPAGYAGPDITNGDSWPPITLKLSRSNTSSTPIPRTEKEDSATGSQAEDQSQSDTKAPGDDSDAKAGVKRDATALDGPEEKPKGRGGSRKRPRVGENGKIDGRITNGRAPANPNMPHKLGPKASQGAINEKLRALDRTKKPCRKWQKTGFTIKSFTRRVWEVPSWNAPQSRAFGEPPESREESINGASKENSSTLAGSDQSPNGEDNSRVESSPVPVPAVAA